MAAVYEQPSLFKLYAEIPYGIEQRLPVEEQVRRHVANSNYGHRGNQQSAKFYEWADLSDYVVEVSRFEHELMHVCLGILCDAEGWSPFLADGNHVAESMIIDAEAFVRLWEPTVEKKVTDFSVYQKVVRDTYSHYKARDQRHFMLGWLAASQSDRPMRAFEARFLGVLPEVGTRVDLQPQGTENKWGEQVPVFEVEHDKMKIFHERLTVLRERMFTALAINDCYSSNKQVCQEFFKTLRMDEIAEIMSGNNPEQELSYDLNRLIEAQERSLCLGKRAFAL